MIPFGDDLIFAIGNQPAGTDGALVCRVAPDGQITTERSLDEQGCHDMHLYDGRVYVSGTDPVESVGEWDFGNVYIRDSDGAWVKRRTLPWVLHCWGLCHASDGALWAATGAWVDGTGIWQGRVLRSTDDGLTWTTNVQLNDYRVYDIIEYNGALYAIGWNWVEADYRYYGQMWQSANGIDWLLVAGVEPYRHQRMVIHDGKLVMIANSMTALIVYDGLTWQTNTLPFTVEYPVFNILSSTPTHLYAVASDGYIWRSSDLTTWTRHSRVANAVSLAHWPSQNCLVTSDRGASAKLWKVAL